MPVRWSCRTGACHNCGTGLISGHRLCIDSGLVRGIAHQHEAGTLPILAQHRARHQVVNAGRQAWPTRDLANSTASSSVLA
jgi:hypothetical protein